MGCRSRIRFRIIQRSARKERFRASDIFRSVFERVVMSRRRNDRVFLSISPSVPRNFQVGYLGIGHAAWLVLVLLRILLAFRNEAVLSGALERLAV